MRSPMKKRSKKAGLPPGTLVYIGDRESMETKITIIDYDEKRFYEKEVSTIEECLPLKDKPTIKWIDIEGLKNIEALGMLGECYGFHPLVLEDVINTDQRPKLEDHGDYIYIVLKMLSYDDKKKEIISEQTSIILGKNFVISFQEGIKGDVFDQIRERLRTGKGRIRKMGADFLAYSLMDAIVDRYFIILEMLGERIEELEEGLVANPRIETLHALQRLKNEMLFLRKSVWPLREVIGNMERGESPLIKKSIRIYLKDVYDHTIQVIDTIETFRDMLSGMLDIYLSSVSNRMNAIMKILTIIATIFMPLTFLVGVYGMNFKYMPELYWRWGYPVVWLIMISIGVSMIIYFKKRKWM